MSFLASAVALILNVLNMATKCKAIGAGNNGFVLAYYSYLAAPLPQRRRTSVIGSAFTRFLVVFRLAHRLPLRANLGHRVSHK